MMNITIALSERNIYIDCIRTDGRETTVSTKILAPRGEARRTPSESPESLVSEPESPSHASADPTQEHVTQTQSNNCNKACYNPKRPKAQLRFETTYIVN